MSVHLSEFLYTHRVMQTSLVMSERLFTPTPVSSQASSCPTPTTTVNTGLCVHFDACPPCLV